MSDMPDSSQSCKGKVGICEKPIFTSPLPSPAICTEGIPTPWSPCSVAIDWLVLLPVFQVEATSMPEAMTICQLGHHYLGSVIVQHLVSTHLSTLGQGLLEKWTKPSIKLKVVAFLSYLGRTSSLSLICSNMAFFWQIKDFGLLQQSSDKALF